MKRRQLLKAIGTTTIIPVITGCNSDQGAEESTTTSATATDDGQRGTSILTNNETETEFQSSERPSNNNTAVPSQNSSNYDYVYGNKTVNISSSGVVTAVSSNQEVGKVRLIEDNTGIDVGFTNVRVIENGSVVNQQGEIVGLVDIPNDNSTETETRTN